MNERDEKSVIGREGGELDAPAGGRPRRFEIEWFEEEEKREGKGGFFASPSPEPPKQPFEIVREPRERARHKVRKAGAHGGQEEPHEGAGPGGLGSEQKIDPPRSTPDLHVDRESKSEAQSRPIKPAEAINRRPPLLIRMFWGFLPILLLLGGYASVALTQQKVGMSWDEAYYYEPAMHAADWVIDVLRARAPFSAQQIEDAWGGDENRPEHPSLVKVAMGLMIRLFRNPRNHLFAMRLPAAISFGLCLTMIYMLGRRAWGTWPGLASALIFATMPRMFGEAHFGTFETPLITATLLVVFCYLRGLDSPLWSFFTGVAFGLAMATKVNAFFLPIPLVLWSHIYARRAYTNNLFAMLTVGPLVMLLVWPWLWLDPANRLLAFLQYYTNHQQTGIFFLGKQWGYRAPNAPWFYPITMIAVTVPVLSLVLIGLGVFKTAVKFAARPYAALYLTIVVVLLGIASVPATPKYDGTRLFVQVFPFLALLGGAAFATIIRRLEDFENELARRRRPMTMKASRVVSIALLMLILLEGVWAEARYYPFMMSYYNHLVGGLKGAGKLGFEVTYWGESVNADVIDELNKLPDGTSIMPLALHEKCLLLYQEWGYLKPGIRIGGAPPYDFHLIQLRRGFYGSAEKLLVNGGRFLPFEVWSSHEAPLLMLFKTGQPFEDVLAGRAG